MGERNKTRIAPRIARGMTVAAIVLLGILILIPVLFMMAPVRNRLLSIAIDRAAAALPGVVSVENGSWPRPGSIELTGVLWTEAGDTLIGVDQVRVSASLRPLLRRELVVRELSVDGLVLDVPSLVSRMGGDSKGAVAKPTSEPGGSFLREGALPGVPSIAISRASISARAVRPGLRDIEIEGSIDAAHGHDPVLRVRHLALATSEESWGIDELGLDIDLGKGQFSGKGHGRISSQWPVYLELEAEGPDRFSIVAGRGKDAGSHESDVEFSVGLTRSGLAVRSLDFGGVIRTPGTDELSSVPVLQERLAFLPPLEGLTLDMKGTLTLDPTLGIHVNTTIRQNAWIDESALEASYANDVLLLRRAAIRLPGLSIDASGRLDPDSLRARAGIDLRNTSGMRSLLPDLNTPPDLQASLDVRVAKQRNQELLDVAIAGRGRAAGREIDRLQLDARIGPGERVPARFQARLETAGTHIGLATSIVRGSPVIVDIAPIIVSTQPIAASALALDREPGRIRFTPDTREIEVDNLRVTGEAGSIVLSGRYDKDETGSFSAQGHWSDFPPVALRFINIPAARLDSLRADWRESGPFELQVEARVNRSVLSAQASFVLPGPAAMSSFMPFARVDDLGPLEGTMDLTMDRNGEGRSIDARLDLDPTGWIDSSMVHVTGWLGRIVVDTLGLALEGVNLGVDGTIGSDRWDLRGRIDTSDLEIVRRFVTGVGLLPNVQLALDTRLAGRPGALSIKASADATIEGQGYDIPRLSMNLSNDTGRLRLRMSIPEGVSTPHLVLDRVNATYDALDSTWALFPARVTLLARFDESEILESMTVSQRNGWLADVDTIGLVTHGKDLRSRGPFQVTWRGNSGGVRIDGMDLAGSLGQVSISGIASPDTATLQAAVALEFPGKPLVLSLPEGLWPERVDIDIDVDDLHRLRTRALVEGLTTAGGRRPALRLEIDAEDNNLRASLSLADSLGSLITGHVDMPAEVLVFPPDIRLLDGSLSSDVFLQDVPFISGLSPKGNAGRLEGVARIDGRIAMRGMANEPAAYLDATVSLPDWKEMKNYRLTTAMRTGAHHVIDSLWTKRRAENEKIAPDAGAYDGLIAGFALDKGNRQIAWGSARYPVRFEMSDKVWRRNDEGQVTVRLESAAVSLDTLDLLLPAGLDLKGDCKLEAFMEGPVKDPAIGGSLESTEFEVTLTDLAHIKAETSIEFGGTTRRPTASGQFEIREGLIQIPDLPKSLHPVEGDAMLIRDAPGDTIVTPRNDRVENASDTTRTRDGLRPDIKVGIRVPSGFYIRGHGLDVELKGNLGIQWTGGQPTVVGELEAVRGTLTFLGKTLRLDKGKVIFHGGDEVINPSLDVVFSTTVDEVKIRVIFAGTARKPEFTLSSEPELMEADIVSLLTFGKTYNELSDDQTDLVRERATAVALSMGAAALQQNLSGQLGIDVIQYRTDTAVGGDSRTGSLAFGSYVHPKLLLSYVRSLHDSSQDYLSLEYFVIGRLKIETAWASKRGAAGFGFGWAWDY